MYGYKLFSILERMDKLIELESTGPPKFFAEKLGISKRSLYNYINILQDLGGRIAFNRAVNSYVYKDSKKLEVKIGYIDKGHQQK